MSRSGWPLVAVAVAVDVVGALAIVRADGMAHVGWLLTAYVLWTATIVVLALGLEHLDTGRAYPVFLGSSTAAVAAASALVLGDHLAPRHWAGLALIVLGVVVARLPADVVARRADA